MVNPTDVGEMIMLVFAPYIPIFAGGIIGIMTTILLIVSIRRLLPESLTS